MPCWEVHGLGEPHSAESVLPQTPHRHNPRSRWSGHVLAVRVPPLPWLLRLEPTAEVRQFLWSQQEAGPFKHKPAVSIVLLH